MSDFILFDIGEGIVECELVKWLVSEGDVIEEDQLVVEVMIDKVLVEIFVFYKGWVMCLYYKEGDIVKVYVLLFELVDESEIIGEIGQLVKVDVLVFSVDLELVESKVLVLFVGGDDVMEDFILLDIGEGIVECEVVEWWVVEGDEIEED